MSILLHTLFIHFDLYKHCTYSKLDVMVWAPHSHYNISVQYYEMTENSVEFAEMIAPSTFQDLFSLFCLFDHYI